MLFALPDCHRLLLWCMTNYIESRFNLLLDCYYSLGTYQTNHTPTIFV